MPNLHGKRENTFSLSIYLLLLKQSSLVLLLHKRHSFELPMVQGQAIMNAKKTPKNVKKKL
jgi:hypothetical protein